MGTQRRACRLRFAMHSMLQPLKSVTQLDFDLLYTHALSVICCCAVYSVLCGKCAQSPGRWDQTWHAVVLCLTDAWSAQALLNVIPRGSTFETFEKSRGHRPDIYRRMPFPLGNTNHVSAAQHLAQMVLERPITEVINRPLLCTEWVVIVSWLPSALYRSFVSARARC